MMVWNCHSNVDQEYGTWIHAPFHYVNHEGGALIEYLYIYIYNILYNIYICLVLLIETQNQTLVSKRWIMVYSHLKPSIFWFYDRYLDINEVFIKWTWWMTLFLRWTREKHVWIQDWWGTSQHAHQNKMCSTKALYILYILQLIVCL